MKRPATDSNEDKILALSDAQARMLLNAPEGDGLKAKRDRAILAVYLFHALRRSELAALKVASLGERRGVMHFTVFGKGSKTRLCAGAFGRLVSHHRLSSCGRSRDGSNRSTLPVGRV